MLIEISLLPPVVQEQILQIQQGKTVQFANHGQVIGELTQSQTTAKRLIGDDKAFGLLKHYNVDGLEYERQIRSEWDREWEK